MQPAVAQDFSITTGTRVQPATAYIFYPLNMIAPALRVSVPDWRFGGTLRHELATLRHRNGYIRQCEITECRQHMVAQAQRNVLPAERRHMIRSYVLTENGESRQIGGGESDDPLLFTPWYPDQELGPVLAQNDGLVRMPVANLSEATEAQYFLFPDWDDYASGRKDLPKKLAQIREHFVARRNEAPLNGMLQFVADAAIRACDLADAFGRAHVARENAMYAEAQTKGWAWSYGIDSELYMEQLSLQRRDNLAQEQANKIDRLADVLSEAFSRRSFTPEIAEATPVVASTQDPSIGAVVRVDGKVGQIVAIGKKDVTVETPDGEMIKTPPSKLEVA